jgi:hypothetical protein
MEEQDLMSFLSDADFPALKERPKTWKKCILALRNEMTNHVVIRSAASLFSININVIDWTGVIYNNSINYNNDNDNNNQ